MAHWDFWSVVGIAGMLQAALLLTYFALNGKSRTPADIFIAGLLLWIVWLQLEFIVLRRSLIISYSFFFGSRHGAWLLPGPLVFHYVNLRLGNVKRFTAPMLLHYGPFVLFTLVIPITVGTTIPERVISYGMLSVLKFPMLSKNWLNTAYGYIFIAQFIHAAIYLGISILAITRYQARAISESSDNRIATFNTLKGIVGATAFFTILSVLFIAVLLNSQWYVRELDYLYIVPMTFCVYLLSYHTIKQSSAFVPPPVAATNPQPYQQSRLAKEESLRLFNKMKQIVADQKLYMNPELRVSDLAEASGMTYHQISEVINREAGISFFEFINDFRLKHATSDFEALIQQNRKVNILEVAFAAGFNNKVSFNRHFKKSIGLTPTEYLRKKSKSL